MTEQQPHIEIPDYAQTLRIAAQTHAAEVTACTVREQHLSTALTRFQEGAARERDGIEQEVREIVAKAETRRRELAEQEQQMIATLQDVGKAKNRHEKDAAGAERAWRRWCHDEGVDPATVPPLRTDTGPLPALPADDGLPFNVTSATQTAAPRSGQHPTTPGFDTLQPGDAGDPEVTRDDIEVPGGEGPEGPFPAGGERA